MKKNFLLSTIVITTFLFKASPSQADLVIGADFTRSHIGYNNHAEDYLADNYNLIGPVLGVSFNGVGIEGFYKTSDDTSNDKNADSKIKSYGADFVLQLPTNEYIDFVGSVGYIKYEFDNDSISLNQNELKCSGPRFGLGMQFNFNRHVGLRTMFHYTSLTSGIEYFDSISELSAGVRLSF